MTFSPRQIGVAVAMEGIRGQKAAGSSGEFVSGSGDATCQLSWLRSPLPRRECSSGGGQAERFGYG